MAAPDDGTGRTDGKRASEAPKAQALKRVKNNTLLLPMEERYDVDGKLITRPQPAPQNHHADKSHDNHITELVMNFLQQIPRFLPHLETFAATGDMEALNYSTSTDWRLAFFGVLPQLRSWAGLGPLDPAASSMIDSLAKIHLEKMPDDVQIAHYERQEQVLLNQIANPPTRKLGKTGTEIAREDREKEERESAEQTLGGGAQKKPVQKVGRPVNTPLQGLSITNNAWRSDLERLISLIGRTSSGNNTLVATLKDIVTGTIFDGPEEDARQVAEYIVHRLTDEDMARLLCFCGRQDPGHRFAEYIDDTINGVIQNTEQKSVALTLYRNQEFSVLPQPKSRCLRCRDTDHCSTTFMGAHSGQFVPGCEPCLLSFQARCIIPCSNCAAIPADDASEPCENCTVLWLPDARSNHDNFGIEHEADNDMESWDLQNQDSFEDTDTGNPHRFAGNEFNRVTNPQNPDPLVNDGLARVFLDLLPDIDSKEFLEHSSSQLLNQLRDMFEGVHTANSHENRMVQVIALWRSYRTCVHLHRGTSRRNMRKVAMLINKAVFKLGLPLFVFSKEPVSADPTAQDGWGVEYAPSGLPFFVESSSNSSQWHDPRDPLARLKPKVAGGDPPGEPPAGPSNTSKQGGGKKQKPSGPQVPQAGSGSALGASSARHPPGSQPQEGHRNAQQHQEMTLEQWQKINYPDILNKPSASKDETGLLTTLEDEDDEEPDFRDERYHDLTLEGNEVCGICNTGVVQKDAKVSNRLFRCEASFHTGNDKVLHLKCAGYVEYDGMPEAGKRFCRPCRAHEGCSTYREKRGEDSQQEARALQEVFAANAKDPSSQVMLDIVNFSINQANALTAFTREANPMEIYIPALALDDTMLEPQTITSLMRVIFKPGSDRQDLEKAWYDDSNVHAIVHATLDRASHDLNAMFISPRTCGSWLNYDPQEIVKLLEHALEIVLRYGWPEEDVEHKLSPPIVPLSDHPSRIVWNTTTDLGLHQADGMPVPPPGTERVVLLFTTTKHWIVAEITPDRTAEDGEGIGLVRTFNSYDIRNISKHGGAIACAFAKLYEHHPNLDWPRQKRWDHEEVGKRAGVTVQNDAWNCGPIAVDTAVCLLKGQTVPKVQPAEVDKWCLMTRQTHLKLLYDPLLRGLAANKVQRDS